MRKMKKLMGILAVTVMLICVAVGCNRKFDASGFVNEFMKLVTTGKAQNFEKYSEEDPEELYNMFIDGISSELESSGVSGDLKEEFISIFQEILSQSKYTVKEAREIEDGFEVDVEIEPILIFDGIYDELVEEATNYGLEQVASGKEVSEEEITQWVLEKMVEKLRKKIDSITYGEAKTVTVHLNKKDGKYEISEEDGVEIGQALFDITGIN